MKQNLIPTVVTDKNGKLTTVHKKPVNDSTARTRLPAPTAATSSTKEQRTELLNEITHRLGVIQDGRNIDTGKTDKDAIRDLLLTTSDNTIAAMNKYVMLELKGGSRAYFERRRFFASLNSRSNTATGRTIHEFLAFKESIPLTKTFSNDTLAIIKTLHDYPQLPDLEDYAEADEDTKHKVTALLSVTDKLYNHYANESVDPSGNDVFDPKSPQELGIPLEFDYIANGKSMLDPQTIRLAGDGLIQLIIDQPEDADDIAKHITEGITDITLLREIFTSENPSLRSGLL